MSDPEVNKVSRRVYKISGALGCFPSLLFFLFIINGGISNALTYGAISVISGSLGVIGLLVAAGIRSSENKNKRQAPGETYK